MEADSRSSLIRSLALASISGQLVWLVVVTVAGALEPGYSEIRDAVSVLGARNAAHPWVFDIAVTIWGLSFVAAAAAMVLDAPRGLRGRLGPGLVALTGLAQVLDGFAFPADCRWSIDAWCRVQEMAGTLSWQHYAHGLTYFAGAIALLASVFAMAWRFHGEERWGRADLLALGSGLLGVAIFGLLFFLVGNEINGHYGLIQRLALAAGGIWVLALAVALLAIYGRRGDPAVRLVRWIRTLPGGQALPLPGSGSH